MSDKYKNILIIKPSALGDIAHALPVLSALRRSFPQAHITWFIRPEFAPLIDHHPHLTNTIIFNRKLLGKAWYNPKAFKALIALIAELRRSKFDTVFDLQGLFRTACLGWLSGCKRRFGMAKAREFARIFYTHKISQTKDCIHVVDYYLKLIESAGASDTEAQFVLPVDSAAADSVNKLLKEYEIESANYVVFVPGSAHDDKRWPIERFAKLADKITSEFGFAVIATGAKSEQPLIGKLQTLAQVKITNFAGLTNLRDLVELLRCSKLVVSNDTGPGHIAAALGTPLVIMFGWSNPARIIPYGRSNCAVAGELYNRGEKIKSTDPKHQVQAIPFDQVYQKVCEQLSNTNV